MSEGAALDAGSSFPPVVFEANPTQLAFIQSRAKADLFACRMGEGKSAALCWAAYYYTRLNPGATLAVIRDTWVNLRDTTLKEFFKWFPPGVFGEWKASTNTYTWRCQDMRGELMFLGMDEPKDAAKLQSRALAGFLMDEPAPASESGGIDEMIFDTAMTRLRQPGMNWYIAKLAENNPDETHWTYKKFVDLETRIQGFECWQTRQPENLVNLPDGYYEDMAQSLQHRPDLKRRFVEGHFGFQQTGKAVTPQWSDSLHLASRLVPVAGKELVLCWDFGHNPTCLITQPTAFHWNVLEVFVGEAIGVYELILQDVKPALAQRYDGFKLRHAGDPAGMTREQTSIRTSPVGVIKAELGGGWRSGPSAEEPRLTPLRWVLSQQRDGRGLLQVDKQHAKALWHALRGGWHYHVARTGVTGKIVKNIHSHPGDAAGYGAAILFPGAKLFSRTGKLRKMVEPSFWRRGFGAPGMRMPKHGEKLQ